jgi:lysophospholipase L1-like esterase
VLDQLKQEYSLNALNLHFVLEQASLKHDLKDLAPDGVHLGHIGNNVVAQAIEAYLETL